MPAQTETCPICGREGRSVYVNTGRFHHHNKTADRHGPRESRFDVLCTGSMMTLEEAHAYLARDNSYGANLIPKERPAAGG